MGNVCKKVIESFGRFRQLFDLHLGIGDDLCPSFDDDPGKKSHHKDQDQMKRDPGDRQIIEGFSVIDHDGDIIGHGQIVGDLTKGDQAFHARSRKQHDQNGHYDRKIVGARRMDAVEKGRTHHQKRVDPHAEYRGSVFSEMNDPAHDHGKDDQGKDELLPSQQDGFTDKKDRTDRKGDQHHQVR